MDVLCSLFVVNLTQSGFGRNDQQMDPLTIIVSAIAAGASAGLTESATQAVKDAYDTVKNLIVGRYRDVDLTPVEKKPESPAKRDSLKEDLESAGAEGDSELLEAAKKLVQIVRAHDEHTGEAIGIDLQRVEAAALRVEDIEARETGVRVRDGRFSGDIDIRGVRAGVEEPKDPPQ